MSKNRQLAAIVFTDISDFTSLMDKDESKALKIRHKQRENINSILNEFDGKYIKELGDGDLIMFNSATDAVNFVLTLQSDISPDDGFSIRAAIHLGDVVKEGSDIFGSGVNMASRIHAFTSPGNTVISEAVYNEVKNKSKFSIKSLGDKTVKGIDEPMHIYQISYKKSKSKEKVHDEKYVEKSLMSDLFERRVPQFIGLYFAISWGIIQFISWVVERYLLSPHLVDLSLSISISMIPSIMILSYFHGRPGKDKWNRIEKIVVPANLFLSIAIMSFMFYPKSLGAQTKDIVVMDIEGKEVTKTIVKSEFRKNFVVYMFDNTAQDTTYNWLGIGIKKSLKADLTQDTFCNSRSYRAESIKTDMGFKIPERLSLGDKQKISKRTLSEYFITGNFKVEEDLYTINVDLYTTSNAKKVSSNQYQGNNFFDLIDTASKQLKIDMDIPAVYLENLTDLPVSERFTDSMEALKYFTYSSYSEEFEKIIYFLAKSVEHDPEFALAHVGLYHHYLMTNNQQGYAEHMGLALKYLNRLNEGVRFRVRMDQHREDNEKRIQILNMWEELYPEDLDPCYVAANIYEMDAKYDKVIHYFNKILRIAPEEHRVLLKLGSAYSILLDYEKALLYYNKYLELYPKNPEGYEEIALVYQTQLDYKRAQEFMVKAQTLGSGGPDFDVKLAKINSKLYKWSAEKFAEELYSIVDKYPPSLEQLMILMEIVHRYHNEGKFRVTIYPMEQFVKLSEPLMGPVFSSIFNIQILNILAELGEEKEELKVILNETLSNITTPPFNMLGGFFKCCFYANTKDWDAFNKNIDNAVEKANALGFGAANIMALLMRGMYFEDINDYSSAKEQLNLVLNTPSALGGNESRIEAYVALGRIHQILEEYDMSEEMFEKGLGVADEYAELFYEYSILKEKQEKIEEARELIIKAYDLYKDGDKELELTQKILKRYEEFQEQLP